MDSALGILVWSAAGVGVIHTLVGVDHTLPFVVLGRAQGWRLRRVLALTFVCGLGHVLSSVILGGLGLGLGLAAARLEWIEGLRGGLAAWGLILFGLGYAGWSFARERRRQRHVHRHADGTVHTHGHDGAHHDHARTNPRTVTAWSLFVIFVLGPCEPLIPLVMLPALDLGVAAAVPVVVAFAASTIGTMLAVVALGYAGLRAPVWRRIEPYGHTLAGVAVAASGLAIKFLGI